jgi:aspartate aminotransferase
MCEDLLKETGVALLPGSDFGFNKKKMLARLSFTDFDGETFLKNISTKSKLDDTIIEKYAPNVVEGIKKLSNWAKKL